MKADMVESELKQGDRIKVNLETGEITLPDGSKDQGQALPSAQLRIYQRGGLLARG
jgi:hypothetical protein